jgi:beta-xylosidase
LRTLVRNQTYSTYGGFFTGAFVGLAAVDYAGYGTQAEFYQFEYQEHIVIGQHCGIQLDRDLGEGHAIEAVFIAVGLLEVGENNRGKYTSYLKDNAIKVPDGVEYVWFRTKVWSGTRRIPRRPAP